MKLTHYLFALFFLFSCSSITAQTKNVSLQFMDYGDTLYLEQRNTKCGEWGGDKQVIRIYKLDKLVEGLVGDYSRIEVSCNDPYNEQSTSQISRIEKKVLDSEQMLLIEDSIKELIDSKLKNKSYPTHAGISNVIKLSDSSLLIADYPSDNWEKFQQLCTTLKSK